MQLIQKIILTKDEINALKTLAKIDCDGVGCDCNSVSCPLQTNDRHCISVLATNLLTKEGIKL